MPPAASPNDYQTISATCCGAFDIAEIEVVHTSTSTINNKSTRIVVSPGNYSDNAATDNNNESSSRYDYLTNVDRTPNSPDRSLADSFDSTDEIIEGSNEMKLMRRVVERQRANVHGGRQGGQLQYQQDRGLVRQDSISDTNSVNANDVFISVENSKEMEYLDGLNNNLNQTNPVVLDYAHIDDETGDLQPNKQQYQANLDDIIEHLCAAPCGECVLPGIDAMDDGNKTKGGYPKSVLRAPRYSSPSRYSPSTEEINGEHNHEEQPNLLPSLLGYNHTVCGSYRDTSGTRRESHSVRFQNVDIRNFKMTLGNHPSATTGPPVMLDSELAEPHHLARKIIPLEKYERNRPPRRKRRQLKLTLQQRHNILVKERGFSFEEVKGAWQNALHIRGQRKETLERGLALMKWDEVWESTCRKFNRLVDSTI